MNQSSFLSLLFGLHLRIRMFVMKRVKKLSPRPKDLETLVDELVENIEIECAKLKFESKDQQDAEKAIWRKAKDTWANYCRQRARRKRFERDLAYLTKQNETTQKFSELDWKDLWNRLRRKITPSEESLYVAVVKDGYTFKQLGELLNVKPATLRQNFYRIRKKLLYILADELMIATK